MSGSGCPECGAKVRSCELGQYCSRCDWDSMSTPENIEPTSDMEYI